MNSERLPHWKLVENVVAAIEAALSTVDGTVVTPNVMIPERVSGLARQVDVRLEIPAAGIRSLRDGGRGRHERTQLEPFVDRLPAGAGCGGILTRHLEGALVGVHIDDQPSGDQTLVSANGPSVTGGRPSPPCRTNVPSGDSAWSFTYSPVSFSRSAKSRIHWMCASTSAGVHRSIVRVHEGVLIRFRREDVTPLPDIGVGEMRLRELTWLADPQDRAVVSAAALAGDVEAWLEEIRSSSVMALDPVA